MRVARSIAAVALAALVAAQPSPDMLPANPQFGVLFDAGSTGTRATIYAWESRVFETVPANLTIPLGLLAVFSNKTTPGIDQPSGRAALATMLQQVAAYLAPYSASFGAFPIFLTATAGMRILDEATRSDAMAQVRAILASSPFLFQPAWARVIPGEEEGVYGWIAANYLLGSLYTLNPASGLPVLGGNTIGALDLGGASTQITFAPPAGVDMIAGAYRTTITDTLAATVYTHSFLYYGQNEGTANINEVALAYAFANGLAVPAPGVIVPHPCFQLGVPLTGATNYTSRSLYPGLHVVFNGTSNWTQCWQFATQTMLKRAYCTTDPKPLPMTWTGAVAPNGAVNASAASGLPPPIAPGLNYSTCSIDGQYQPSLVPPPAAVAAGSKNVTLYAFSGYTYLWEFYNLPYSTPLSNLVSTISAGCAMTYAQFNATYGSTPYTPTYCLVGAFVTALLTVGYGVPQDSTFITVAPSAAIPVTYAAGAMLYSVNNLQWYLNLTGNTTTVYEQGPEPSTSWVGLAVAVGVVGLALIMAIVYILRSRVENRGGSGASPRGPSSSHGVSLQFTATENPVVKEYV